MELMNQARQKIADAIAPKPKKAPVKTTKAMLDEVKKKVKAVDNTQLDREDIISLAYFKGIQYSVWDPIGNRLIDAPMERVSNTNKYKTRYKANRIWKIVRTEYAKIFKTPVQMYVVPASSDEEDIDAAKLGNKIAEWVEYDKELQTLDRRQVLWGLNTRISFMHPYWNRSLGELASEDGDREGDIDFDVLSCFEVKYDPAATFWKDARWACSAKVRDVDYILETYGAKVDPEKGLTESNIYDSKMTFAQVQGKIKHTPLEHHARVFEYWELPSPKYPNGRRITYCENHDNPLYESDDIGWGDGDDTPRELPFFPFVHSEIPGCVHGTNSNEQIRPLQREYNRTRSQIIDAKDMYAYPKRVQPIGSLDNDDSDSMDEILEYVPGSQPPSYLQPPQISPDAYQDCQQILEEMDFISGQNQITHGKVPSDMSGYLAEILIEEDTTVLAPTIENYIACKQAYMSYVLKMIRNNYRENRTLKIVGRNSVEMIDVIGSKLTSTDVRIQRGPMAQRSMAAKIAQVFSYVGMGVLNPREDRDKIFKWTEFGMDDEMYREAEQDEKQAKEEQRRWEKGDIMFDARTSVRDFFNHDVHIEEHNRWRKSRLYEAMPTEAQEQIDMHVRAHQAYIMNAMAQQAMLQAGPGGEEEAGMESPGTPPKFGTVVENMSNGDGVGNSMQGAEAPPAV